MTRVLRSQGVLRGGRAVGWDFEAIPALLLLLVGCAAYQTAGDFQAGRQALLRSEPREALRNFLDVAERDPDHAYRWMGFREGIWTYIGRAQYQLGRFPAAHQALRRALAQNPDDHMARLYLGLTLIHMGQYERGVQQLVSGMGALHNWLEYMEYNRPFEGRWDPAGDIRRAIRNELSAIEAGTVDRQDLIASAEWLGKRMEEEIDWLRRDWRRRRDRELERRSAERLSLTWKYTAT